MAEGTAPLVGNEIHSTVQPLRRVDDFPELCAIPRSQAKTADLLSGGSGGVAAQGPDFKLQGLSSGSRGAIRIPYARVFHWTACRGS